MYQHFLSRVQPGALALCLLSLGFSSFFLMSLLQGVYVISPVQQISPYFENFSHTHNCVSSFPNNCCMDGNSYLFDICRDTEVHNLHKLSYVLNKKLYKRSISSLLWMPCFDCHLWFINSINPANICTNTNFSLDDQAYLKQNKYRQNSHRSATVACCDVHIYAL